MTNLLRRVAALGVLAVLVLCAPAAQSPVLAFGSGLQAAAVKPDAATSVRYYRYYGYHRHHRHHHHHRHYYRYHPYRYYGYYGHHHYHRYHRHHGLYIRVVI